MVTCQINNLLNQNTLNYKKNSIARLLWWHFSIAVTWCRLYRAFTYIYPLLIEKDIWDRWNISVKLLCVRVCLSSTDLFIFLIRVSSFFSYFFIKWLSRQSETHCRRNHFPEMLIKWLSGQSETHCRRNNFLKILIKWLSGQSET